MANNPNPKHINREQKSLDRAEIVMRVHLLNKGYRIVNPNFHSNELIKNAAIAIRELNKDTNLKIENGTITQDEMNFRPGE